MKFFLFLSYNFHSPIFQNENHHFCFTLRRRSTNLYLFYFYHRSSQAAFSIFIIFWPGVVIGPLSSWAPDQLSSTYLGCLLQWPSDNTRSWDRGWCSLSRSLIKKNPNVINLISFKIKLRPSFGMESIEHITATLGWG